jgi:hypothetical protein
MLKEQLKGKGGGFKRNTFNKGPEKEYFLTLSFHVFRYSTQFVKRPDVQCA